MIERLSKGDVPFLVSDQPDQYFFLTTISTTDIDSEHPGVVALYDAQIGITGKENN